MLAACMAQWFSSTIPARIGLYGTRIAERGNFSRPLCHAVVNDITVRYKGKTLYHTDGTGLILDATLKALLINHPNCPKNLNNVSIIQVRYGGAKGTLVRWKADVVSSCAREALGGHGNVDIAFRKPSMVKFITKYEHLDICQIGKRSPYYRNRSIILLLKHHGVADSVFLSMQNSMLYALDAMLYESRHAEKAVRYLLRAGTALKDVLLRMLRFGMSPATDPFLHSCLKSIRSRRINGPLRKARIFVENGVTLMGGVDEMGCLPEGCVFFQACSPENDEDDDASYAPHVGPVMVTKHPMMHSGDVRMLLAVDMPEFRDKRNVLLFSQKGAHSEPDKMAGSDLDGDEYAITWDNRLFLDEWNGCRKNARGGFESNRSVLVMKGIAQDAIELGRVNVEPVWMKSTDERPSLLFSIADDGLLSERILDHFFDYQRNNIMGQLAMLWLDHAAMEGKGAGSPECTSLAKQYSIAVDYAKSGKPAIIPQQLFLHCRDRRAHWREVKYLPPVHCTSVIGQLYDNALLSDQDSRFKQQLAVVGRKVDKFGVITFAFDSKSEAHACLNKIYNPWIPVHLGLNVMGVDPINRMYVRKMRERGIAQRQAFDSMLASLMDYHGILSKGALFTGCLRKNHQLRRCRQYEVSKVVRYLCRDISNKFRKSFFIAVLKQIKLMLYENTADEYGRLRQNDGLKELLCRNSCYLNLRTNGYLQDMNAEAIKDEYMKWVEAHATKNQPVGSREDFLARAVSRHMAAAYYEATYSPVCRIPLSGKRIYFSFPWIVADVIFHEQSRI
jgi:hypothetical protein